MARVGSAAAVIAVLTASALGRADEPTVEAATAAFAAARFEQARNLTHALIGSADIQRADLARAHALASALELMFGQEEQARASADAAIALDPTVAPPEGSPEAVAPLFAVMRDQRRGRPIRLTVGFSPPERTGGAVRAHALLEEAPPALAGAVDLGCRVGAGAETSARTEGARADLLVAVPRVLTGVQLTCRARALTPGGAAVLETRAEMTVGDEPGDAVSATIGGQTRSGAAHGGSSARTWTWVGLGAVTVATIVGIVLVVAATSGGDVTIGSPEVQGF